jgi:FkbM family methyltransferase
MTSKPLLARLAFRRNYQQFADFMFSRNEYGSYCIPLAASHRPAAQCVLRGDVWERNTIEFMLDHAAGRDVITAGAFFGDALPALSKACRWVWAFEPNPESFRCAQITVLMNDLNNVTLLRAGLGEKCETRKLVVRDHQGRSLGGASQIAEITNRGSESVLVDMRTLDSVIAADADISIIHLDVEGFEEYALRGAHGILESRRPLLILETVPKSLGAYRLQRQLDHQACLLAPCPEQ